MSVYLRLVVGSVVVCDLDLFSKVTKPDPDKDPPPQLAGGTGTLIYPDPPEEPVAFGFSRPCPTPQTSPDGAQTDMTQKEQR